MKKVCLILGFALAAVFTLSAQVNSGVGPQDKCGPPPPVKVTPIGHPIWKPVDFHVFAAPAGGNNDGFAEFTQSMRDLLHPVRHNWCGGGVEPGEAHQPPYLHELEAGLLVMNYKDAFMFSVQEFTPPSGVLAEFMVVPDPGTKGLSQDSLSVPGPIIPNSLFPIHVASHTYRNGEVWNWNLAIFDVSPTTNLLCPQATGDGYSHFPIFLGENTDENPGGKATGNFEFRVTMTDTSGNGWNITIYFKVR